MGWFGFTCHWKYHHLIERIWVSISLS